MKVKVVDDRLIVYEEEITSYGYLEVRKIDVNALDVAKALKPYLDSIENCEVKK